jgi:hypothetical protein
MPAMRFPQIQEFSPDRYSDFTTRRALRAADKGKRDGFVRNPLCRLTIFSASFLYLLHRNINRLRAAEKFPLTN